MLEQPEKESAEGVPVRILTKDNFKEYIDIPDYVLEKYEHGLILPAHLSDIVRCCLLYKYGGVWLDSTILMCGPMPGECMEYCFCALRAGKSYFVF